MCSFATALLEGGAMKHNGNVALELATASAVKRNKIFTVFMVRVLRMLSKDAT